MAQPGTPEQWVQRSQLIPHAASGVVVQLLEEDSNDFLRNVSTPRKRWKPRPAHLEFAVNFQYHLAIRRRPVRRWTPHGSSHVAVGNSPQT